MNLPSFVQLNPELEAFLGYFADVYKFFGNIIAMLVVFLFVVLMVRHAFGAFSAMKAGEGNAAFNPGDVIKATVYNMIEITALALLVFLTVIHGPNVIYGLAIAAGDLLVPSQEDVSVYAGPFQNLFLWIQSAACLATVLFGTAYLMYRGLQIYFGQGAEVRDSDKFARLQHAVQYTWKTGVLIVILFLAIRFGPNLLFSALGELQGAIQA